MKKILVITLMLVASVACGQPTDIPCVSDTTLSLTSGYNQEGPRSFDIATDGNASISFYWFLEASRDSVIKSRLYFLRSAYPPRNISFQGSGPDSVGLDVVTATEVMVTVTP